MPYEEYTRLFGDPAADVLFREPLLPAHSDDSAETFMRKVSDALSRIMSYDDERVLAIHGALVAEGALDDLLGDYLPGYKSLLNWSFSSKIRLLRALSIVPERFSRYLDVIRDIRNDFAHQIGLAKVGDTNDRHLARMRVAARELVKDAEERQSDRDRLRNLIWNTASALQVYRPGIQLLSETIRARGFLNDLRREAERRDALQCEGKRSAV
jgi:hypothetical protein